MGAIAAIHTREGEPDEGACRRMLAAAPHRGSVVSTATRDGSVLGIVVDEAAPAAFMAASDRQTLVFGGALDNRADLARELGLAEDADPAATALVVLGRWGTAGLERLRGSFSGAMSDGRSLWCFRDQFGTRPLFHRDEPRSFYTATEVKMVVAGAGLPREPDWEHLEGIIFGGITSSTAVRGVQRVPRCGVGEVSADGPVRFTRYWDPEQFVETLRATPEQACEGFREALRTATLRMLSGADALLLSGGLDSTALAAFAAGAHLDGDREPVLAVTTVYPDHPSADEERWTRLVADHLGMPLHTHPPEAASLDDVELWVDRLDGPVDVLSVPEAAESYEFSRSLGARTVLSGEVAEYLLENRGYLIDHLVGHGRLRALAGEVRTRRAAGRRWQTSAFEIGRALAPPPLLAARVHRRRGKTGMRGVPDWIDAQRMAATSAARPLVAYGPRQRWRRLQTMPFHGAGVGFEVDEIVAAHCGVDIRRPFADVDLWQYVLGLPAEVKYPDARVKGLLRDAMRGLLPDEVLDRTDKTFFDEYHLATADYPTLRRYLVNPQDRLSGIDYDDLGRRIEAGTLTISELQWARDLVRIHAFLNL